MTALNQIDGHEIESKKVHKIEDNKNGEFPTPDLLTDGKIDPKKAEVKATQTIEEAAKEKNSAEREKKPNIFWKIGTFFSDVFRKSPKDRTEADNYAVQKYEETKKQLSEESKKTSLPESYATNNSNHNETDKQ